MDRRRWLKAAVTAGMVAAGACSAGNSPDDRPDSAADAEEAVAAEAGSPAATDYNATDVRKGVLDLYVTRQEYIELYWGPGGRLTSGESLGATIVASEARFHELMTMLSEMPPPPAAQVTEAAEAVVSAHLAVLEEARAAGVPLDPAAADSLIEGTPPGGLEDWITDIREGLRALPLGSGGGVDAP